MLSRRAFLKSSALAMFGVGSAPAWLSRALYAKDPSPARGKVLVVIFQRGAVDGLNVVVPHAEKTYYALCPTIAIPRPDGSDASAIDLDGHFGLHPSLRALKPMWDKGQLVGGLYGLAVGSLFAGESMFHLRTGASKVAFAAAVDRLRKSGFTLFDVQVMSPHLGSLGCAEIPRSEYLRLVESAVEQPRRF